MNFIWKGPITARNETLLMPGAPCEFTQEDAQLATYLELGYLEEAASGKCLVGSGKQKT